ncbi:MAG: glutamate--tRNA ligase family protein, partial [Candidatus Nanoarchaeia archaeon]|nr:glutamate--tRNA ligase family protein [Candidatus Nanoarchaeia archaeon]
MELKDTIRKLALENAIKFKGKANPGALVGGIVKLYPETKTDMSSLQSKINQIVEEINSLTLEQQQKELLQLNPSYFEEKQQQKTQRQEQRSHLPELPNAVQGKVITRIPPEPSKYNHLGHAMSFLINYLYAKKYDGKVIFRFDDTNPEKSTQEFVDSAKEDVLNYLDIKPDELLFASEHMEKYYQYAEKLVNENQAYVCSCPQEKMSDGRRNG